jgi:hypothetical protein
MQGVQMKCLQGMLFILGFFVVPASLAEVAKVVFETRILSFDPFPGMKSTHTVILNQTDNKIIFSDSYETGTTDFFGVKLSSIRNNFKISNTSYNLDQDQAGFKVTGETASGVGVVPNINYSFDVQIKDERIHLKGCHDGYPAYTVTLIVPGESPVTVYDFKHKPMRVINLFGNCDTAVNTSVELP